MSAWQHGTARVHYTARLGDGTKVWADAQIDQGAMIGKNCVIGVGAQIGPNVTIGDDCKIQSHAQIYEGVTIGNRVFIGPSVVTTNDPRPCAVGDWSDRFRQTFIGDDVAIGANATILPVTIGNGALIGAGSVVTKDVKPNWEVWGNPAQHKRRKD